MTKRKESRIVDPDLKSKWVASLRSGQYKQGKGRLKKNNFLTHTNGPVCEHCCLGVLCELVAPEGFQNRASYGDIEHKFPGSKRYNHSYPNEARMREIGLNRTVMRDLALMNDDGYSFAAIADYIEEKL